MQKLRSFETCILLFFLYGGLDGAFRTSKEAEAIQEGAKAQTEATRHNLFIGILIVFGLGFDGAYPRLYRPLQPGRIRRYEQPVFLVILI